MTEDTILTAIIEELSQRHACHTIILYGSRARGEQTETSDYDIMGVKESGESYRDARLWNGRYLDLFIHPERKILEPDHTLLHLRGGKILRQKDDLGTRFFARLEEIFTAGPKKLPADEIEARRTWAAKSLARIRAGGLEGDFRRMEFVPAFLEDFFATRGLWYRGPKESLRWLKANRPRLHEAFAEALKPGAPISAFERLLTEETQEEEKRETKP